MTPATKAAIAGVVLALAAGAAAVPRLAARLTPMRVGVAAPAFAATTLTTPATTRTIEDYRGEVVLLNLWATWCGPCVVEMPSIQRLYDRYRARGLRVVGVAVDDPPFAQRVRDFVQERALTFDIVHEGSGKIEADYGSRGIPSTFIIDREGRVRVIRQGATDWDVPAYHAVIERLLETPPAGASGTR